MSLSAFMPNTTVTVLRTPVSTVTADYGEPVDDDTQVPGMANVPALLRAKSQRVWDPQTNRYMQTTVYSVRFRPGANVKQYDRIKDAAGNYYSISSVTSNASAVGNRTDVVAQATAVE